MKKNYKIDIKIIDDSNKFRPAATTFEKYGYYTSAPPGTTAYMTFWDEELYRSIHGYVTDSGEYITGYFYFYLNYSVIIITKKEKGIDRFGKKRNIIKRVERFPRFYDYDRSYFDVIEEAEETGKHLVVLKARGKGYSYKGASMLCRNFYCIPKSKSYAVASESEFLTKDGLLTKAWDMMSFIDLNTAWGKKRQKKDTVMHKRASFILDDDTFGIKSEQGWGSEIMGITLKNDPQKARGKRGKLILWEEGGKFPGLKEAWQISRPSVEDGNVAFGLMIAFGTGGCVCAGTKVWNNEGNICNIEKLDQRKGILGFNSEQISKEQITYWQKPIKKKCYKIITNTKRELECSEDHPILTAIQDREFKGHIIGNFFTEVSKLQINNKIAVIDNVPIFGKNKMWEPRLIGWLIGDGSYRDKGTPKLSNCESEINDYIESNFDCTVYLSRLTKQNNKIYKEIGIKNIIPKLRELGIYGQVKLEKTLPENVHSYCKEDICELLGGLFDTDGYVNLRYNKKRGTPIAEISISSMSNFLLNEIRFLLQKLGIHGRLRERLPRKNNPLDKNSWFEFTIADKRSLINFSNNISLYPKVKRERLNKINEIFSTIKAHINHEGIRYETIKSIKCIGIKKVYNLTANNTNTYIANGIITHNTEDADFEGIKDLFYEPLAYNALSIENEWDDGAQETGCGFFVPQYYNIEGEDENGNSFMDKNGNSNLLLSKRFSLEERDVIIEHSSDKASIDRYIAERPFCLSGDSWVSVKSQNDNITIDRIKDIDNKYDNGIEEVYELITENGRSLKSTKTHHIYNGTDYKKLIDYKVGDDVKLHSINFSDKYQNVKIDYGIVNGYFDLKIDEEWGKFIGMYMGDGSYYGRRYVNTLEFSLDKRDKEQVNWLDYFISKNNLGVINIRIFDNMIKLRVSNVKLLDLFKKLDLIKRKKNERWKRWIHVPDYIIKSPRSVVAAFLSGIFDTDGSITKNQGSISLYSKYTEFTKNIVMLLSGFEIYPNYSEIKKINTKGNYYTGRRLTIRKQHNILFLNEIGFISFRKQNILELNKYKGKGLKDWSYDKIKEINYVGKENVYNLKTNCHYYSANGIWTHNSPIEATLQISGNIFPKKDLIRHLAEIRNSTKLKEFKQVGDLYFDSKGKITWEINTRYKDLTKYRVSANDDPAGAIVIWEHPIEDAPYGLYVIGCLLPGEQVLTNDGLMSVEDVGYSDRLVDKDGSLVDIKEYLKYEKENEEVYTVKVSNTYRTTTFTKEHPLYISEHPLDKQRIVKESLFDFDFKEISNVKEKNWIKYPNVYLNENYDYEEHSCVIGEYNSEHWWFRGLWLGDGWCSNNRVYIAFDVINNKQLQRVINYAKKYYGRKVSMRKRGNSIECSFNNKWLANYLIETFGKYANGKFIPEYIKYEKNIIKENLMLGFLDSDGCICKDKREYYSLEYVSINLRLLEDIQDIAFSLGLVGNLTKLRDEREYVINGRTGQQQKAYHLRFGHSDTIAFAKFHDFDNRSKLEKIEKNNVKITRSRPKSGCFISKDNNYIYFQIKNIIKGFYTGPVYNFETETHSYCTHHISTHNCDPYDHDQSGTGSLGSLFVYKRIQSFEQYYDLPVAEYTGRPATAEDFYEKVRALSLYFNAKILYENEKKGLFSHFSHKHCEYLLADQPDIIKDVIRDSKVQRGKGIHMNKSIKDWGEGLVKDWLIEEYAPGKKNLTKIFSEPLLEELISYNSEGNFDRVMAFMMVVIYIQELYHVNVKKKEKIIKKSLFQGGIFRGDRDIKLII